MTHAILHSHSDYSLLDGASQIPQMIKRAQELNMPAIALTDHGVMYGAIELLKETKGKGIKPIIGNEMYILNGDHTVQERLRPKYHQIVLAKNLKGYQNLVKLTTLSHLEGFQGRGIFARPCINKETLAQYHEGLIVTSACLGGEIPQAILQKKPEIARDIARWYKDLFGDDYYIELQDHGSREDRVVNPELVRIARELDIQLVVTNDSHFISCLDVEAHDALLCIMTGKTVTDDKRLHYSGTEYIKSTEEMKALFADHLAPEIIDEALANTLAVAEKIEDYRDDLLGADGKTPDHLPVYPVPEGYTPLSYLTHLAEEGLAARFPHGVSEAYQKRLKHELSVIHTMGFPNYFLVVWDYINFARESDIPVGLGRGCVLPGTLVTTSNGDQKPIEQIKKGDRIITHAGVVSPVTDYAAYPCKEDIVSIEHGTEVLSLTGDHKLWAVKTSPCVVGGKKQAQLCKPSCSKYCKPKPYQSYEVDWHPAGSLQKNDCLVFPRNFSQNKPIIFDVAEILSDLPICFDDQYVWYEVGSNHRIQSKVTRFLPLDSNLAKFLGYFVAEGWVRTGEREATIGLGFSGDEQEYIGETITLFEVLFGLKAEQTPHKERNSIQVLAYNKPLAQFLERICSKGSNHIHIPDVIVENGLDDLVKILLSYLFRGDGSDADSTFAIKYTSTSLKLASQVKLLLSRFGFYGSLSEDDRTGENENWALQYNVKLSGKQLLSWNACFTGFLIRIPDQKYFSNNSFWMDEKAFYLKITKVSSKPYDGLVFDITVPGDTSYIANGAAIHNSAAGSLVSYCLRITNIDPIHHGLLFERFLNIDRVSMPDVDTDFCPDGRERVIEYVTKKYGSDRVAQIITYNRMTSKAVLKDTGRVLNVPYAEADRMSKMVTAKFGKVTKLKEMIGEESPAPAFREYYETGGEGKRWIDLAMKLEGVNKSAGVHAAGVVISDISLDTLVPLERNKDGVVFTQYSMFDIEALGLLKMDFLGLKNLTIIQKTCNLIRDKGLPVPDLEHLDMEDAKTFALMSKGWLEGVFQLESSGMRATVAALKPTCIEDVSAILALYRPGPMSAGLDKAFINRKNGTEAVHYDHPILEPILSDTYGIMVYQEQITKIAVALAGYTHPGADLMRRCIAGDAVVPFTDGSMVTMKQIYEEPERWVGKTVSSLDERYKIVSGNVSAVFYNGTRQVFRLETRSGRSIKATEDHLFRTLMDWKQLKDLQAGNYIALPTVLACDSQESLISDELIKVAAYMIGDGRIAEQVSAHYFCSADPKVLQDFNQCIQRILGQIPEVDYSQADHMPNPVGYSRVARLNGYREQILPLFEGISGHCRGHLVPRWVYKLSLRQLKLFVATLWNCEGGFTKQGIGEFSSTSEELVRACQHLFLRLGIQTTFGYHRTTYCGEPYLSYRAWVAGIEDVIQFNEELYAYLSLEKQEQLRNAVNLALGRKPSQGKYNLPSEVLYKIKAAKARTGMTWKEIDAATGSKRGTMSSGLNFQEDPTRALATHRVRKFGIAFQDQELIDLANSDVLWDEIISITSLGEEEVFDLTVDEFHNFIANDIVAHNCIGKKDKKKMKEHTDKFIQGASIHLGEAKAQKLWQDIEGFADYSFNMSHSVSYAYISYQTAYLKANYPTEYMASLLTSNAGDQDSVQKYLAACVQMGIQIDLPDINRSDVDFTPAGNRILFGLSAIKNLGNAAIESILVSRRADGPFGSMADLCDRISVNKRALEALIHAGAFDQLHPNRKQLLEWMPQVTSWAGVRSKDRLSGQMNFLTMMEEVHGVAGFEMAPAAPEVIDYKPIERLRLEKEILGFYVSDHPLKGMVEIQKRLALTALADADDTPTDTFVYVVAMVTAHRKIFTKKGDAMSILTLEDLSGRLDAVVFPKTYEKTGQHITQDARLFIQGKITRRDERPQLVIEHLEPLESAQMLLIDLVPEQVDFDVFQKIRGAVVEHRGEPFECFTPLVVAIQRGKHQCHVTLGRQFWVQDPERVLPAIQRGGLPAETKLLLGLADEI